MSIQRFKFDELPVTPWKNGGGTTREVGPGRPARASTTSTGA